MACSRFPHQPQGKITTADVPWRPELLAKLPPSNRTSRPMIFVPTPCGVGQATSPLSDTMQTHDWPFRASLTRTTPSSRFGNACFAEFVTNSAMTRPKSSQQTAGNVLASAVTSQRTPMPSVLRHQLIADLKVTFGGGEKVAAAAGHGNDRTQARYESIQHGRKRKGYLTITSARTPRSGNVDRARQLSRVKVTRRRT
jgi:hypothetical protein